MVTEINWIENKQTGKKINWLQKGYKLPSKIERAKRQMVIESNLDSLATSPKGAYGWFQMLPGTHNDYVKETGDRSSFGHLSNFDQAFKERNWYMDKLNNLDFLKDKPGTPLVKAAKTYATYNAGPGPIVNALNDAKARGEDIYNSLGWLNDIPEESRNYVNKMFGKDPTFEQKYKESKSNPNASFLKKIKFQAGGLFNTNKTAYVDSVLNANKHLDWVKRLFENHPISIPTPKDISSEKGMMSTHLMSDNNEGYMFPRLQLINGKLTDLGNRAEDYARDTNTGIQLPKIQGTWLARNGYKQGTGVLIKYQKGNKLFLIPKN